MPAKAEGQVGGARTSLAIRPLAMEQIPVLPRRHLMSSGPSPAALTARRVGAAILTGGSAVGFFAVTHRFDGDISLATAFSVLLGAAAVGFTRRSLGAQVASRAATWLLFAPTAMVTIAEGLHGEVDAEVIPFALATGAALLLASPALHAPEARRFFDPVRFRRLFVAGATAMTSAALVALAFAVDGLRSYAFEPLTVALSGGLAVALLTSVVALLRMRGWGLLLGGATSLAALAVAPFVRTADGIALALAAIPALLLWVLPVVAGRTRAGTEPVRLRVEATPARTRIADASELDLSDEALDLEMRPAAASATGRAVG